ADEFTRALTEGLADPDDDSALAAVIGSTERMRKATFRILTDRIAAGGLDRAQARKLAEQAPDVADALAPAIPLRGKLGVALGTIDAWAHMVGRSRFADPEILAAEAEELWTATETHFAQRLSDRQPPADFGPHPGPDNPERTGIPGITG
ncbi:MAG: hypothetical protein GXX90_10975, partial [Microbacteriaceae bacterium]|nr:hypothetical protein [Microbacteriaceae bacterium]